MREFHCLDCNNIFFSSGIGINLVDNIRTCPYCKSTSVTEQIKLVTFFHKT